MGATTSSESANQPGQPAPVADPMLAAVVAIVREVCGDPAIRLTRATATDDIPGWQEAGRCAVAAEAECRFGVTFQVAEIVALANLGDLIALIGRKRPSPAPAP